MNCEICHSPSGDLRFCQQCIDSVAKLLAAPTPTKHVQHAQRPPKFYWLVRHGDFVCVIDGRDAATHDDALREASSSLTPWYATNTVVPHAVEWIDHDAYCKWLRGKASEASTIKNGT